MNAPSDGDGPEARRYPSVFRRRRCLRRPGLACKAIDRPETFDPNWFHLVVEVVIVAGLARAATGAEGFPD
jgi:hypothetical protein